MSLVIRTLSVRAHRRPTTNSIMLKIPAEIDQAIEKFIADSRVPHKALVNSILDLSDYYQRPGVSTPWEKKSTTASTFLNSGAK